MTDSVRLTTPELLARLSLSLAVSAFDVAAMGGAAIGSEHLARQVRAGAVALPGYHPGLCHALLSLAPHAILGGKPDPTRLGSLFASSCAASPTLTDALTAACASSGLAQSALLDLWVPAIGSPSTTVAAVGTSAVDSTGPTFWPRTLNRHARAWGPALAGFLAVGLVSLLVTAHTARDARIIYPDEKPGAPQGSGSSVGNGLDYSVAPPIPVPSLTSNPDYSPKAPPK